MNEELRKLQMTQVEILKVIDYVCKKHGIKYSLYAGTLLGAVRHKGFIPWDDDLDICMSRTDYEHFLRAWENESPAGFLIQNKENTPTFTQSFTKIRKDHTTFLQYDWEKERYHTGIFVDIFPIDRLPISKIKRAFFLWNGMRYQLYTREFIPEKSNVLIRIISSFLLHIVPVSVRGNKRKDLLEKLKKYTDHELPTVAIETVGTLKTPLPSKLLDDYVTMEFEGEKFMCFALWDEYLTLTYHDYMKLPPEEERTWTHHPIILDFSHNYEELKDA